MEGEEIGESNKTPIIRQNEQMNEKKKIVNQYISTMNDGALLPKVLPALARGW